ncbi:MAG: ethanolamine ammonia-lyase light chain family protein [Verrucomicrobiaceae bacterium]|nr:ethanolamine ammonia-lyase light chain family protein [Verrucomicrobiaceae bacterium]
MSAAKPSIIPDNWQELRQFTAARIALGRVGVSLPTNAMLEFQLAHARARDAVHLVFDAEKISAQLHAVELKTLTVQSAALDRHSYLQRPDLGRKLSSESRDLLERKREKHKENSEQVDIAFVIADGLSALAIHHNAVEFIVPLIAQLQKTNWSIAPIVLARQGRVAIGDEIGSLLNAKIVVVLIGERPGLSSPDSMGIYMTWAPQSGLTDAARNCISNVREGGLSFTEASFRLNYLLSESRLRKLSGVELKDETVTMVDLDSDTRNFLIDN